MASSTALGRLGGVAVPAVLSRLPPPDLQDPGLPAAGGQDSLDHDERHRLTRVLPLGQAEALHRVLGERHEALEVPQGRGLVRRRGRGEEAHDT